MPSKSPPRPFRWLLSLALAVLLNVQSPVHSAIQASRLQPAPVEQAAPLLMLTRIPAFGSSAPLEGKALNVNPPDFKVAAFVFVSGLGWFCKPSAANRFEPLRPDGSFSINVVTGGVDDTATVLAVFLVGRAFDLSCVTSAATLPTVLFTQAAARLLIHRDNPRVRSLSFSGLEFECKENRVPLNPGPLRYGCGADNVWLDERGLHLKLVRRSDGQWYGAEVYSKNYVAPGGYSLVLASDVSGLAAQRSPVFGFFTFSEGQEARFNSEIDVEYGSLGNNDGRNAQVLNQPFTVPQNIQRFVTPPTDSSVSQFNWQPGGRVDFKILRGMNPGTTDPAAIITQFTPAQEVLAKGDERLRLNLWLFNNTPPNDNREVEVVIKEIRYQPTAPVHLSAASYRNSPGLAAGSLVACFGANLSAATAVATTLPLPTVLAGRTVRVRDGAGTERAAPLFFVSPNQLNYQLPAGTALGTTTVSVVNENGALIAAATIQVVHAAPTLFSANASGRGPAAAVVLRIKPDGAQSFEPVARCNASECLTIPIELTPGDQFILLLFGTGLRGRNALSTVAAQIGEFSQTGRPLEVLYAGPQPDFAGLDQVNLRLPATLSGSGEVSVALLADALLTNTVRINLR